MVALTRAGWLDASIRAFAEEIVRNIWRHDYLSEYAAVLNWCRRNIRYVRDPVTIEQVKTPRAVIETEAGDCDDQSVLIATLCGALGARVRFVAGGFKGDGALAHVWCEAFDPASGAWVVLDPVPGRNVTKMLGHLRNTKVEEVN
jgi:transglutaminase-like putative cysteine protease